MSKKIFFFIFLITYIISGQEISTQKKHSKEIGDLIKKDSLKVFNPLLKDYYFIENNQKYFVYDSLFNLKKMYKYTNFTQKDIFGKLHFPNIGSSFNPILFESKNTEIDMIPVGKSFNLTPYQEVRYFNVKTPMTEFNYNNGFKQGQSLRTLFTHNISPRWNYALEYYGINSEGKYLNESSESNTLIISSNYQTKNQLYNIKTHYLSTNINNNENGGIKNLEDFTSNNKDFRQRERLEVNLNSSKSKFHTRRYFIEQKLGFLKGYKKDSISYNSIEFKNISYYESSEYSYSESSSNSIFFNSDVLTDANLWNTKNFKKLSTISSVLFNYKDYLTFEGGFKYENLNFFFGGNYEVNPNLIIPKEIKDNRIGAVGKLNFKLNDKLNLISDANISFGDYFKTTFYVNSNLDYIAYKDYTLKAKFNVKSLAPSLIYLLNQSYYVNYNFNFSDYKNEFTTQLSADLSSKKYKTSLGLDLFNISNYTYFNALGKPNQTINPVSIVQFHLLNELNYKKFGLETRVSYQKLDDSQNVIPLPEFIARLTFFYQDLAFKNAATIQTGIKFHYFSKFQSREFNPILNEFMVSNTGTFIGEYPVFDVFFNLLVKRMRVFIEAQHLNSSMSKNFLIDPVRPFYDFRLNIGINWLIFN